MFGHKARRIKQLEFDLGTTKSLRDLCQKLLWESRDEVKQIARDYEKLLDEFSELSSKYQIAIKLESDRLSEDLHKRILSLEIERSKAAVKKSNKKAK